MIMKTYSLLWSILFSNQKSGASCVFGDLDTLVSLKNVKNTCGGVSYFVKFQAVSVHLC